MGILAVLEVGSFWWSVGNIARLDGIHGTTRAVVIVKCLKGFTRAQCASIRCAEQCAGCNYAKQLVVGVVWRSARENMNLDFGVRMQ